MNTYLIKIIHIATGLASIGFAVLCVLAAFFAAGIVAVAFLLVTSVGLLVYGVPAYVWGFVSVIREKTAIAAPTGIMQIGLLLALIGMMGVLAL